jgi:hypothetical protein
LEKLKIKKLKIPIGISQKCPNKRLLWEARGEEEAS